MGRTAFRLIRRIKCHIRVRSLVLVHEWIRLQEQFYPCGGRFLCRLTEHIGIVRKQLHNNLLPYPEADERGSFTTCDHAFQQLDFYDK